MFKILFREESLSHASKKYSSVGEPTSALPPSWSRITILLLCIVLTIAGFIAAADVPRTETVRGVLRSEAGEAKLYAERVGVISELWVTPGDHVEAEQAILEVSADRMMSTGTGLQSQTLAGLRTEERVLQAQLENVTNGQSIERADLQHLANSAATKLINLNRQLEIAARQLDIARNRAADAAEYLEEQLIAEPQLNERLEAVAVLEQSLISLETQISDTTAEKEHLELEISKLGNRTEREALELQRMISQVRNQINAVEAERAQIVTTPISGTVASLSARKGEYTRGSAPVAVIVPENSKLLAEVYVSTRSIGFVEIDQSVNLQIDAFPYQKFGTATGTVHTISQVAQSPTDLGLEQAEAILLYRIEIALDQQSIDVFDESVPLQSGMELSAAIVLEKRKLIEWFLEPILRSG